MMVDKMVDMRGGEKDVMKQTRKDRELIAADELLVTDKARQDSEMHRLYAAFLENNELGIEEAEELLKNVKNSKKVKKSQSCSKNTMDNVDENCSKNIIGSVGEKQNAVDVRKKTVETGWSRGLRKSRVVL
jgi:Tfp pilus assembly protein PilW